MIKLDAALAAKLCAEAMKDGSGFEGRFFYDAERGDIGWIAKDCDDKQCDCEVKTNADGDQDCSHSLYDWEGEDHINEPIVRMLNRHRALAEQLMAALEELTRLRSDEATMKLSQMLGLGDPVRPDIHASVCRQRDAALREVERMRAVLATPCETEVSWHNNGRGPRVVFEAGSDDYVVTAERALSLGAALVRTALAAISQDKERP